jgi:hypothetical protein
VGPEGFGCERRGMGQVIQPRPRLWSKHYTSLRYGGGCPAPPPSATAASRPLGATRRCAPSPRRLRRRALTAACVRAPTPGLRRFRCASVTHTTPTPSHTLPHPPTPSHTLPHPPTPRLRHRAHSATPLRHPRPRAQAFATRAPTAASLRDGGGCRALPPPASAASAVRGTHHPTPSQTAPTPHPHRTHTAPTLHPHHPTPRPLRRPTPPPHSATPAPRRLRRRALTAACAFTTRPPARAPRGWTTVSGVGGVGLP